MVQAHGGDIWADSIEGKGTTVTFTLPYNEEQEDDWDEALVFTWNIWMFQPVMQDQADTGTKVVETKKISSDEPRSLIDVVKPREISIFRAEI
ncbi:hypothetical protein CGLO_12980 [Colletotrichum gloeosporioides Cg-14]|uniref:Histidine kinase/HSP90-like ATPase domain-containing protein n=1 Tax=Colletotrichum gloeosporioides (strain Cg-14) TaxID=1237896 RepID=T0L871_COLGC|nr:hypothetical protein CGLO_12980 [Colletotrichum gloeosporioides Cg-14]